MVPGVSVKEGVSQCTRYGHSIYYSIILSIARSDLLLQYFPFLLIYSGSTLSYAAGLTCQSLTAQVRSGILPNRGPSNINYSLPASSAFGFPIHKPFDCKKVWITSYAPVAL